MHPGDRIGDWIVESALGKGGMGSVYLCHNAMSDRLRAAVKVIENTRPEHKERFLREVEAIDRVRHPFVVGVKGWGEDGGRLWIAMELVEGENLQSRLARGPMSEGEAIELIRGLASALSLAHSKGVTHRDVKPANIVLSADGARLVDFGIARHDDLTRLTADGRVAGTPVYLPPEAFTGRPDPVAMDVYALGLVFYETLTGEEVFPAVSGLSSGHQIARLIADKNASAAFDPGEGFPDPVRECIRRATAPGLASRLASMDDFLAVLDGEEPASGGETFFVDTTAPDLVALPPSRSIRWPLVGLAVVVVLIVAGVLVVGTPDEAEPEPVMEPEPAKVHERRGKIKIETDDALVEGVLKGNKSNLTRCYDAALADDPSIVGMMKVDLSIGDGGSVTSLEVVQAPVDAQQLTDCVTETLRGIVFRRPADDVHVSFRFLTF